MSCSAAIAGLILYITADMLPAIIANPQGRGFGLGTFSKLLQSAPKGQ
jgi:hypothetical protein